MRDVRQNKGSILRATVEYVRALKEDQVKMKSLEEKLKYQEFQQRKLMRMLQVLTILVGADKCIPSDLI